MNKNKILIIGNGSIANRHYKNIIELNYSVEKIPYREFIKKNLDLIQNYSSVIICTASDIRINIIKTCYLYNVPFFCEKPLSTSLNELKIISQFDKKFLSKCFVGFMMRYHPVVKELKKIKLENVHAFTFRIGYNVNEWRKNWSFSRSYSSNIKSGGVLFDLCHEIDLSELIFGNLSLIGCYSLDHKDFKNIDFYSKIILGKKNIIGEINMDYINSSNVRTLEIMTNDLNYYIDFNECYFSKVNGKKNQRKDYKFNRNQMFIDIMKDFLLNKENKALKNSNAPILLNNLNISKKIIQCRKERTIVGTIPYFKLN